MRNKSSPLCPTEGGGNVQILDDGRVYEPARPTTHGRDRLPEPPANRRDRYDAARTAFANFVHSNAPTIEREPTDNAESPVSPWIARTLATLCLIGLFTVVVLVFLAARHLFSSSEPDDAAPISEAPHPTEIAGPEPAESVPADLSKLQARCTPSVFMLPVAHAHIDEQTPQCTVTDGSAPSFSYMVGTTSTEVIEKLRAGELSFGEIQPLNVAPQPGHQLVAVAGDVAQVYDILNDHTALQFTIPSGLDQAPAVLAAAGVAL